MLSTRNFKATVILDPREVASLPEPKTPRVPLRIRASDDGRAVTVDINAKSVRKAKATIAENGTDGVGVIIQGKLIGDAIVEAGLVAQVRVPKPVEPAMVSA